MISFVRRLLAIGLSVALIFAAPGAGQAQTSGKLVVFAAASLATALNAIQPIFTQDKNQPVAISYGSSGTLAKQIEQSAPADVFISADTKWIDYLEKKKLLASGTRRDLLSNELVLIEPADGQTKLKIRPGFDLATLAGDGKIAVCTVASCPAGIYAKEAFTKLGVWSAVEPKLAQAANVRDALALVARGEAKFGIVYATDAKAEPKVRVIDVFPADSHTPIIYPVAVVASSKNANAAVFEAFLTSQAAVKILTKQGFKFVSKRGE
jgi:molybdate transport system substrate-binding protein